jgi:membrane protein DedA with SNARE-associated domain
MRVHDILAYLTVLVASIVEGEVAFVGAATLVSAGHLRGLPVLIAGAVGAAIGDQAYFYAFRGRITRIIARYPALDRRTGPLVGLVRRHDAAMVSAIRFAPGFRVALAAACAHADVSPVKFTLLNTLTCVAWAALLMVAIARLGPAFLQRIGITGGEAALLVAGVILLLVFVLAAVQRRVITASAQKSAD